MKVNVNPYDKPLNLGEALQIALKRLQEFASRNFGSDQSAQLDKPFAELPERDPASTVPMVPKAIGEDGKAIEP